MHGHRISIPWLKQCITVCLQGDERSQAAAHSELARRLWPAALRIARSYQQNSAILAAYGPHIAEDAAAHAYARFIENLEEQAARTHVIHWFHATIRSFLTAEERHYSHYPTTNDQSCFDQPVYAAISPIILERSLYAYLKLLKQDYLHVVYFRYWESTEQKAIAGHWKLTRQRISQLELAALCDLKEWLQHDGYTYDGGADAAFL